MSNIIHFRPLSTKPKTDEDPLGTIELAGDILQGAVRKEIKSVIALVHFEGGGFEVMQSGNPNNLELMGALHFAALDIHAFCKAVAAANVDEQAGC